MKKAAPQYQQSSPRKVDSSTPTIPGTVMHGSHGQVLAERIALAGMHGKPMTPASGRKLRRLLMAQGYSKAEAAYLARQIGGAV